MTEIQKKMLDSVGGDMVVYNNMVTFGNFMCDMINKYGKEVIQEIEEEDKEKRSTSDNAV